MAILSVLVLSGVLSGGFAASAVHLPAASEQTTGAGQLSNPAVAPPPVLSSFSTSSYYNVPSPYEPANLRRHYEQAAADKTAGEKFYKLLADYKDRDALVLGYKGAAEAIRARDASMFNKLNYVQEATRTFEQAVNLDPQNPEIRFLRFSVESNLPAFLGLSKHVDEDKELLLNAALKHPNSGLDTEAFRVVRNFLVERGHVTDEEALRLKKVAE
jgi:tetratricopeptide (TPR) repeat protein